MSAGATVAEAHRLACQAIGPIALMLERKRLSSAVLGESLEKLQQSVALLRPLVEGARESSS